MERDMGKEIICQLVEEDIMEKIYNIILPRFIHGYFTAKYLKEVYDTIYFNTKNNVDPLDETLNRTQLEPDILKKIIVLLQGKEEKQTKMKLRRELQLKREKGNLLEWQKFIGNLNLLVEQLIQILKRYHFKIRYELESLPILFSEPPRIHLRFLSRNHVAVVNWYIEAIKARINRKQEIQKQEKDLIFFFEDLDTHLDFYPEKNGIFEKMLSEFKKFFSENDKFDFDSLEKIAAIRGPFYAMDSFRYIPIYAHSFIHSQLIAQLRHKIMYDLNFSENEKYKAFTSSIVMLLNAIQDLFKEATGNNKDVYKIINLSYINTIIDDILSDFLSIRLVGPAYFFAFLLFALCESEFLSEFIIPETGSFNYWIRTYIQLKLVKKFYGKSINNILKKISNNIEILKSIEAFLLELLNEFAEEKNAMFALNFISFSNRVVEIMESLDENIDFKRYSLKKKESVFENLYKGFLPFLKEEEWGKDKNKLIKTLEKGFSKLVNRETDFALFDLFNFLWLQIFLKLYEVNKDKKQSTTSDRIKKWYEARIIRFGTDLIHYFRIADSKKKREEFMEKYFPRVPLYITLIDCFYKNATDFCNFIENFKKGEKDNIIKGMFPIFGNYDLILFHEEGKERSALETIYYEAERKNVNIYFHTFNTMGDLMLTKKIHAVSQMKEALEKAVAEESLAVLFRVKFKRHQRVPFIIEKILDHQNCIAGFRSSSWDTCMFLFKISDIKRDVFDFYKILNSISDSNSKLANLTKLYMFLDGEEIKKQLKDIEKHIKDEKIMQRFSFYDAKTLPVFENGEKFSLISHLQGRIESDSSTFVKHIKKLINPKNSKDIKVEIKFIPFPSQNEAILKWEWNLSNYNNVGKIKKEIMKIAAIILNLTSQPES